jgi:hypothetical protein
MRINLLVLLFYALCISAKYNVDEVNKVFYLVDISGDPVVETNVDKFIARQTTIDEEKVWRFHLVLHFILQEPSDATKPLEEIDPTKEEQTIVEKKDDDFEGEPLYMTSASGGRFVCRIPHTPNELLPKKETKSTEDELKSLTAEHVINILGEALGKTHDSPCLYKVFCSWFCV